MILFQSENTEMPDFKHREVINWIKRTVAGYGFQTGDISFIFCNDEKILAINKQYLQHDYYTDIITFDYSAGKIISGDIFISIDTVESNAGLYKIPFRNELFRIIIHGILHLCGQDDKTPEERNQMTIKENEALSDILTS